MHHLDRALSGRRLVEWINVNFFDAYRGVPDVVLLNLLIPVKRFLLAHALARGGRCSGLAGWRLARRAPGAAWSLVLALFIAVTGLVGEGDGRRSIWCGVSVVDRRR